MLKQSRRLMVPTLLHRSTNFWRVHYLTRFIRPTVQICCRAPYSALQLVASVSRGSARKNTTYECLECGRKVTGWAGFRTLCRLRQVQPESQPSKAKGGVAAVQEAIRTGKAQQQLDSVWRNGGGLEPVGHGKGWVRNSAGLQSLRQVIEDRRKGGYSDKICLQDAAGAEVCRVLGGGVVPGSLLLCGGDPGVGKSTLLLQLALQLGSLSALPKNSPTGPMLYISGEESVDQVARRAERLAADAPEDFLLLAETSMASILQRIVEIQPRATVIDSIQTMWLDDVTGSAGSVSQVRECSAAILRMCKDIGSAAFLVGHVTKSGDIAGPRVLEHIVDVVLYLEGERSSAYRLLRGVKNRFGPTDEVGVFEMKQGGLAVVADPAARFLEGRTPAGLGAASCVTVVMEGSRPMLLEIQALCSPAPNLKERGAIRSVTGLNTQRVNLMLTVLNKIQGMRTYTMDVHLNVVSGLTLTETSCDLAVAMAAAASIANKEIPLDMVAMGEVGLGGELRSISHMERRILEAQKLGFKQVVVPAAAKVSSHQKPGSRFDTLSIIACHTLTEALERVLSIHPRRAAKE